MNWLTVSLFSSLFFAISSLIDKLFIDKVLSKVSAFSLVVISAIAGFPFLFFLFVFSNNLPDIRTIIFGFSAGWLVLSGTYFYYSSLRKADPALIMATFQLVLPFNYILGLIFLDEVLSVTQIVGALIVVGSSLIVSIEEKEGSWRIRHNTLFLMAFASLLISASDVVFKLGSSDSGFFTLAVAEYMGTCLAGLIIIFLNRKVNRELRYLFRYQKKKLLGISQINEAVYLTATFLFRYGITLGPIALVQVMIGVSPIFVMLLAWLVGVIIPKLSLDKLTRKDKFFRFIGIGLSCVGIAILSL